MLGDNDVNVTKNNINLCILNIIPSPETQKIFDEAITKSFTLSFDSRTSHRKPVKTGTEFQLDIGSSFNINATFCLIAAHQKTQRNNPIGTDDPPAKSSNNRFSTSICDNVTVKNYFVEIDGMTS